MSALSHIKSNPVADFTGTVTVFNSAGSTVTANATDLVRPGDWNSVHNFYNSISGNTSGTSTASGTNLVFGATGGLTASHSTAAGAATLWFSAPGTSSLVGVAPISISTAGSTISILAAPALMNFVPYWPASTSSQTIGAVGVSTASAWIFPFIVDEPIKFNELRILQNHSYVTTNTSGGQTITSGYGIFSLNGATLSSISSSSYSIAMTGSGVSATFSFMTSTGTAGYTYSTTAITGTNHGNSLFGSLGARVAGLQFGNSMSLGPGLYYLGIHQRQSTTGALVGISSALVGNAMGVMNNVAPFGSASSAITTNHSVRLGAWGPFTSTNSAGHSGTRLPASMALSGIAGTVSIMPMMTFLST